jgi:mRNA interferase RelE/StbE
MPEPLRYTISYKPSAAKAFAKIHPQDRRRVKDTIESLAENPRPPQGVQLVGGDGEWRVRAGDYRIIYDIEDHRLVILVLRIGHRREVYR